MTVAIPPSHCLIVGCECEAFPGTQPPAPPVDSLTMPPPRLPSDTGELLDLFDAVKAELQKRRGRGRPSCPKSAPRCDGMAMRGDCYCWDGVPLPTLGELRERAGRQPIVLRLSYRPERRAEVLAAVDRSIAELADAGLVIGVEVDRG